MNISETPLPDSAWFCVPTALQYWSFHNYQCFHVIYLGKKIHFSHYRYQDNVEQWKMEILRFLAEVIQRYNLLHSNLGSNKTVKITHQRKNRQNSNVFCSCFKVPDLSKLWLSLQFKSLLGGLNLLIFHEILLIWWFHLSA